nr:hypothetical protein [Tanacetum cinerariifolium]
IKDTKVPQLSVPTSVTDEVVNEKMYGSLERAATTATSLDAEQDRGNILKNQSKATPNEPRSQGTSSEVNTSQSGEDSLKLNKLMELCTKLQERVLDLETIRTTQEMEIESLKRRVKKLERRKRSRTHKLKRLYKVGLSARVESSDDESLDAEMFFDVADDLRGEEIKDKGKAKMIEEPVTLKKKDQIQLDKEVALKLQEELQAEFEKEQRLESKRAQQEKEANIALIELLDDVQAKIDAGYELDQRLQAKEQDELTDAEKAKLLMEILEKRRKFFATKRAEEKKNRPPTKA